MAIDRKIQKVFGGSLSPSGNIAVYGSKKAGSPTFSDNVETLQSTSWLQGIMGATSTDKAPYVQDLNSIFYVITKQLAYLFQSGVAEWDSQTEYFAYKSLVSYNGKIFVSVQDSTNKNPSSEGAYWLEYSQLFIKYLPTTYNIDVATAIGGYPLGAILYYTDSSDNTFKIQSLINNNTNEPSASNIQFENSGEGTYYWKALPLRQTNESIVIKTWKSGTSWYRLYSDGWCEQGGWIDNANSWVSLHLAMTDTNYLALATNRLSGAYEAVTVDRSNNYRSTSSFYVGQSSHSAPFQWLVIGYANI